MTQTIAALRQVLGGNTFRPRAVQGSETVLPNDQLFRQLSPRQRDVLLLLCEGCSNKKIARRQTLQKATVKAHLRQVFRKLDVTNRTQAVKLVLQGGWPG